MTEGLTKMAETFATEHTSGDLGVESSVRAIHHAVSNWRPFVQGKQVTKERATEMSQYVVNMLLVEYARDDMTFEVPIHFQRFVFV